MVAGRTMFRGPDGTPVPVQRFLHTYFVVGGQWRGHILLRQA